MHRGDWRTPPPRKLNAWDAGGVAAHITYANGTRGTLPAESYQRQKADGGLQHCPVFLSSEAPPGARKGTQARHTGPHRPPASGHACVTTNPAHQAGQNVPASQHEPNPPNHRNRQTQHCDTGTPATWLATHGTIRRTAGRQTQARAPHHPARTAPWGSHGEHGMHQRGPTWPCHRRGVYI